MQRHLFTFYRTSHWKFSYILSSRCVVNLPCPPRTIAFQSPQPKRKDNRVECATISYSLIELLSEEIFCCEPNLSLCCCCHPARRIECGWKSILEVNNKLLHWPGLSAEAQQLVDQFCVEPDQPVFAVARVLCLGLHSTTKTFN